MAFQSIWYLAGGGGGMSRGTGGTATSGGGAGASGPSGFGGNGKWVQMIDAVKAKYPKPEEP